MANYCQRIIEGSWPVIQLNFTRWKYGFAVELFWGWWMYGHQLEQAPAPWDQEF
jgi:hypothetical protein